VLVAVFPLAAGGAACLQLQDDAELRRGGVYLLTEDDPDLPAVAPRFDELFADAASKLAAHPGLRGHLVGLLERGREAAQACLPRLTPEALRGLVGLANAASDLDGAAPAAEGAYSWEALVLCAALIFVSEEERYPRPRFRGADVALERFLDVIGP
jgi:hypothetical protein